MAKVKDLFVRWILPNCGCLAPALIIGLVFVLVMLSLNEGGLPIFGGKSKGCNIPEPQLKVLSKASNQFVIQLPLLAAVGEKESSFLSRDINYDWSTVISSAGAIGPFQFIPSTWKNNGQDAGGSTYAEDPEGIPDNKKEIASVWDAGSGAAHLLVNNGAGGNVSPDTPAGLKKIIDALSIYNSGKDWKVGKNIRETREYVDKVLKFYEKYNCPSQIFTTAELAPPLGLSFNYTNPNLQNKTPHTVEARGHGLFDSLHGGKKQKGDGIDWYDPNNRELPVYAVSDGIVERKGTFESTYGFGGWYVYIYNKENEIESFYAHIFLDPGLKEGQTVRKGQQIGVIYGKERKEKLGFKRPHLHFQLWINQDELTQTQLSQFFSKLK